MVKQSDCQRALDVAVASEANVLITGNTGTGKTRLARMIHDAGRRAGKPFVSVNLASLHEGTLESELFGHEKGAFTGADSRRTGRLELAQGGTVFLDEIGELTPRLQARLLEFLQARTVSPVGSNRELALNVRIIAATHRDLRANVANGLFREDLFHRLRVVTLPMKPLIERGGDFDAIFHEILSDLSRTSGKTINGISEEVACRFENYPWPGNIRELRNVLEYSISATRGTQITLADLPEWFGERLEEPGTAGEAPLGVASVPLGYNFKKVMQDFEQEYFRRALKRCGGGVSRTARRIGVSKTTLLRRLQKHGLSHSDDFWGAEQVKGRL